MTAICNCEMPQAGNDKALGESNFKPFEFTQTRSTGIIIDCKNDHVRRTHISYSVNRLDTTPDFLLCGNS